MTVKAIATCSLDVSETIAAASAPASPSDGVGNTRRFNLYNQDNKTIDGSTTPSIDSVADMSFTLAAATKTFDLTAVPDAKDIADSLDMTGKKLIGIILVADAANDSGGVTVQADSTNGYNLFGSAAFGITLWPGQTFEYFTLGIAAQVADVAAAAKNITFTGTVGDVVSCIAVFG